MAEFNHIKRSSSSEFDDIENIEDTEDFSENTRLFGQIEEDTPYHVSTTKETTQLSFKDYCVIIIALTVVFVVGLFSYGLFLPSDQGGQEPSGGIEPLDPVLSLPPSLQPSPESKGDGEKWNKQDEETPAPTTRPMKIEGNAGKKSTPAPTTRPMKIEGNSGKRSTPSPTTRPMKAKDGSETTTKVQTGDASFIDDGDWVSELGFSKYPGWSEIKQMKSGQFVQDLVNIFKEKHQEEAQNNIRLKNRNIPPENEFDWDTLHIKDCEKVNKKYGQQLMSFYSRNKVTDPLRVFTSDWDLNVPDEEYDNLKDAEHLLGYNPKSVASMLEELRTSLVYFYEVESDENFLQLFDVTAPRMHSREFNMGVKQLANAFLRKLVYKETFVIAVYGSSVMSGQDNCWYNTYPMQLQRMLNKVFSIFNSPEITATVKPGGQNGDGAAIYPQIKCAQEIFEDFDVLQTGYWMIPKTPGDFEAFVRRVLKEGKLIHSLEGFGLDGNMKGRNEATQVGYEKLMKEYYAAGMMEHRLYWQKTYNLPGAFPWWPEERYQWGRQGDGRCHMHTREGIDGTFMENWHPGPLGFQMMIDKTLYYYSFALSVAMKELEDFITDFKANNPSSEQTSEALYASLKKKYSPKAKWHRSLNDFPILSKDCSDVGTDDASSFPSPELDVCNVDDKNDYRAIRCATGFRPLYNEPANLETFMVSGGFIEDEANRKVENENWKFRLTKSQSRISANRDPSFRANEKVYTDREECNAHPDEGYGWEANNKRSQTEWIKFAIPKLSKGRVEVCSSTHQYQDFMDNLNIRINDFPIPNEKKSKYDTCIVITWPELFAVDKSELQVKYNGDDRARLGFLIMT